MKRDQRLIKLATEIRNNARNLQFDVIEKKHRAANTRLIKLETLIETFREERERVRKEARK